MKILSFLVLIGFFVVMPMWLLNYAVMPQLEAIQEFYQSAEQLSGETIYNGRPGLTESP